jgi:hypothetical protein
VAYATHLATPPLLPHERRVCRVLDSRGQAGLGESLARLDGTAFGGHYRLESLYAAGGEGVVFLARDLRDPASRLVAKIPLVPFHRPADLSSNFLRRRREQLREEARNLETTGSRFLPRTCGLHEIPNPLLDHARGGEFAVPEPVLVMEWMPGFDLDLWLARVHRSDVPVQLLRRNLDRVAVVLLQALVDLEEQGFHYADLRPGNLRMMGRPERRIRLLDAGSLVEHGDESGRFPHVPAYLPPALFQHKRDTGETIVPSAEAQAIMAGRTLFEVATGRVPTPGVEIERGLLADSHVSAPVAEVVDGLAVGDFADVRKALRYLEKRAVKRVAIPLDAHKPVTGPIHPSIVHQAMSSVRAPSGRHGGQVPYAPVAAPHARPTLAEVIPVLRPLPEARPPEPAPETQDILPPPRSRSWWKRLFGG